MLHDLWVPDGCRGCSGEWSRAAHEQEQCQRHAHPRRARVQGRAGYLQLPYGTPFTLTPTEYLYLGVVPQSRVITPCGRQVNAEARLGK